MGNASLGDAFFNVHTKIDERKCYVSRYQFILFLIFALTYMYIGVDERLTYDHFLYYSNDNSNKKTTKDDIDYVLSRIAK